MRFRRIADAVCAQDRAYFEQHPGDATYVRDYVPGELWPLVFPQNTAIVVRRLVASRADARTRTPVAGHSAAELLQLLADPRVSFLGIGGGAGAHRATRLDEVDTAA